MQPRDPITGTTRHTLTGHTHGVARLGVAPDRSWLTSVDASGEVRVWDLASATTHHILTGHRGGVSEMWWLPMGTGWLLPPVTTARCGSGTRSPALPATILTGHRGGVWALLVAPDGSWLASAGEDGSSGFGIRPPAWPAMSSPVISTGCGR
jgi:WD40 repeat protein